MNIFKLIILIIKCKWRVLLNMSEFLIFLQIVMMILFIIYLFNSNRNNYSKVNVIDKENRVISAIDKNGNNIFFGDVEVKGALKYEVLPQYYLDEKKRVANLLSNDEHDFVIGFFADPHAVEDNRYSKYNDLL